VASTKSSLGAESEGNRPPGISHSEIRLEASEPLTLEDEIEKQRGVPKTPQGWWTLGLTVMAILIAVILWLCYY
jgi:hypothetical protein